MQKKKSTFKDWLVEILFLVNGFILAGIKPKIDW
jgi:hypothetical protein